jgi:CRISPR/Cas system-associated exonuclease Cas4 (RecB family)
MSAGDGEKSEGFALPIIEGSERDDGYWVDSSGAVLRVSASDMERHAYCPMSWYLSRVGVSGEGEALKEGRRVHEKIHDRMQEYQDRESTARNEMIIWSWWFTVVVTLAADSAAFFFIGEDVVSAGIVGNVAKFLVALALVWLCIALALIWIPWRRWLGYPFGLAQPPTFADTSGLNEMEMVTDSLHTDNEEDGATGGRLEARILIASIAIGLHGLALYLAEDQSIASFTLLVFAIAWLLITAWKLHQVLSANVAASKARSKAGLQEDDILAYSDDDGITASLLIDEVSGLRGRPDQIVRIDNQFIPVEQKTGKIPLRAHESHQQQVRAYLRLVEKTTEIRPDYGILRYGSDALFTVEWDAAAEAILDEGIREIQRLMVNGGATRNHQRVGKCKNCSRRNNCPESLA